MRMRKTSMLKKSLLGEFDARGNSAAEREKNCFIAPNASRSGGLIK